MDLSWLLNIIGTCLYLEALTSPLLLHHYQQTLKKKKAEESISSILYGWEAQHKFKFSLLNTVIYILSSCEALPLLRHLNQQPRTRERWIGWKAFAHPSCLLVFIPERFLIPKYLVYNFCFRPQVCNNWNWEECQNRIRSQVRFLSAICWIAFFSYLWCS